MKKQLFLYGCIIIVFIICGLLYINNQFDSTNTSANEPISSEKDLQFNDELFVDSITNKTDSSNNKVKGEVIDEKEKTNKEEQIIEKEMKKFLSVYICGAVSNPGVYTLQEGSRITEVLDMAGGPLEDADLNQLNLAEKIVDEQKIYVPKIGEEIDKSLIKVENRDESTLPINNDDGLININTASSEQLQTLSGIGAVIAQNIIDYRNAQGPFKSINEIKNVSRIGDKTFEKIKSKITAN